MQSNYHGFALAVVSMIGLGISTFLYKKSTGAIGAVNTTFFYYLFSVGIAAIVWFFFHEDGTIESADLVWPALIAIFLFSSVLSFNYAVKFINVSVGSTVRSLSFVVTVGLSLLFYKEHLHLKDYVALGFAITAIVLFGLDLKE